MAFVVYKSLRPSFSPAATRLADNYIGSQWFDWAASNVGKQPAVNVQEKPDTFVVEIAVPGLRKEDFKVELEGNVLKVSVEQTEKEQADAQGKYHRREFGQAVFQRYFTLPKSVDGDNIGAAYQDGILTVTLPKRAEAQPKPPKQIMIA